MNPDNTPNTIYDFLQDKSFLNWVLNPDTSDGHYWEELAKDKEKGILLNQAREIVLEIDRPGSDWDTEDQLKVLSKIHQRINLKNSQNTPVKTPIRTQHRETSRVPRLTHVYSVLVVLFLGFVTVVALDVLKSGEEPEIAVPEPEVTWVTKFNPKGQKSKIHLPDGSTVLINAESEIRFKSNFGVKDRDIYLSGEAFFEVAPDSLMPFRVFSEEVITKALGTSFNINSYDPDYIRVQLATGKVEVSCKSLVNESFFLEPGEELRTVGRKFKKEKFDLSKAFLWKSGVLLFENASLTSFKLTLERWYGVDIELVNIPKHPLKISGEFKDIYLSNVLEAIGYAYGFEYTIDQKEVKLVFTR